MDIRFENGLILFDSNKITFHEDCCCIISPTIPCQWCDDLVAPEFVDITIDGITNGRCANSTCENFNGTFRQQSLVECNWNKRYFGCSEGLPFDINFGFDAFGQLFGALGIPGEGPIYECFDPDETDCLNWSDLVMTKTIETIPPDPFCLNYPATFTVSAV